MSYWRDKAKCLRVDPEVMFPEGKPGGEPRQRSASVPLALCSVCPVTRQCARLALDTGMQAGVFGGVDLGGFSTSWRGTEARRAALEAAAGITEEVNA